MNSWTNFERVTEPALTLAPSDYLSDLRANLIAYGVPLAVAMRDTKTLFQSLVGATQFQGISDRNAAAFVAKNGAILWDDIAAAVDACQTCPRLRNYWTFDGCGYRKSAATCAEPGHLRSCSLPTHPARKGSLAVTAYSLYFFIRDVCDGDLVGWIDQRLADADPGRRAFDRARIMGEALLEPLRNVSGVSDKVLSMWLADVLLASDPHREPWITTGAGMIVIDTLLHNFLHRTGVLRRFGLDHVYGATCYAPGGCADLMRGLADRTDARQFNPTFPKSFARFIQFAVWRFCSTSELDTCNGIHIDRNHQCRNSACPVYDDCDRIPLQLRQ